MEKIEFFDERLKERYFKITHKSGLDIYVFPKKMTGSYALFGTEYGSVDNRFRIKGDGEFVTVPDGIAHYLEHRMFTQRDGSDITERFSVCGADSNAYTSFNKTVYLCSSADNFEEALAALLDFVTQPYFTEELVEKERGIIIQEIKMTDDSPYSKGYRRILEAMYKSNSVRVDIAGSVESVSQITADMLNSCYKTFYTPNNMSVVVCGDITPEKVMEIADATIPDDFVSVDVERCYCFDEPDEVNMPLCKDYMEVSKPIFTIGVKDNESGLDDRERMRKFTEMSVLCELIFSKSGELYNYLFDSGKVTPDFSASYLTSKTFAYTLISGESDMPEEVFEYIKDYVKKFSFTSDELSRCKRVLYAEFVMDFDSTEEIANNMIDYIFEGFDLFEYGRMLENVSEDDVNRLLGKMFRDEYYAMSVIYPLQEEGSK